MHLLTVGIINMAVYYVNSTGRDSAKYLRISIPLYLFYALGWNMTWITQSPQDWHFTQNWLINIKPTKYVKKGNITIPKDKFYWRHNKGTPSPHNFLNCIFLLLLQEQYYLQRVQNRMISN